MLGFLTPALFLLGVSLAANGCTTPEVTGHGLNVDFYKWPINNSSVKTDPNFFNVTYASYGYLGSVTGVTAGNFSADFTAETRTPQTGRVYGFELTISNFTMEATGYFLANTTGKHNFTIKADDGVVLQFGATSDDCCGDIQEQVGDSSFKAMYPDLVSEIFLLTAGVYYPVRIVYVNYQDYANLALGYTDPNGVTVSDFASQIVQISQQAQCIVTTTQTWTKTYATTITLLGLSTEYVIVEVPKSTVTISTYWTGSITTSTTASGSSGESNTVIIQLPPTTTTTSWSNDYTSTLTLIPTDGGQPTVVVQLPPEGITYSTYTTPWTNPYTTTSVETGSDGTPRVVVKTPEETPEEITYSTYTTPWTNPYTTTSVESRSDGPPIVVVKTPEETPEEITYSTYTTPWTNPYTTTSTESRSDGPPIVVVKTPSHITTVTITGTYSYTTSSVVSGTDGKTTNEVIVPSSSVPAHFSSGGWNLTFLSSTLSSSMQSTMSTTSLPVSGTSVLSPVMSGNVVSSDENISSPTVATVITTTTSTDSNGKTTIETLTITSTFCPKCEHSPVETGTSSLFPTTTETRTFAVTTTNGKGETEILTSTLTTTYCPASDTSLTGQATTASTPGQNGTGNTMVPGNGNGNGNESASAKPLTMVAISTYGGNAPVMGMVLSMAILPLLALLI